MSSSYSTGLNSESGNTLANPFLRDSASPLGSAVSTSTYTESDSDNRNSEGFDDASVSSTAAKQIPQHSPRTLLRKPSNKRLFTNPLGLSLPPSRPLSQASSMSGVSTTAFKDGIEGNRPQRFTDPQDYSTWINSTIPNDNNDPNMFESDINLQNGEDLYSFYNQSTEDGANELNRNINVQKPTPMRPNQFNNEQSYDVFSGAATDSSKPTSLSEKVQGQ